MKLYLVRHGIAEDTSGSGRDYDRRLTLEGIADMERVAEGLRRLDVRLDAILTSPLDRARETAEILARVLTGPDSPTVDDRLAPGFGPTALQAILHEVGPARRLMLVGHNFDLPLLAVHLVGGGAIDLKKGGLIRIDADSAAAGAGVLEWLLTPKLLMATGWEQSDGS